MKTLFAASCFLAVLGNMGLAQPRLPSNSLVSVAAIHPIGQSFTAQAPAPSEWGFANYGAWVGAGTANRGYTRIRAGSTNGVSITMQIYYVDVNGQERIDASGGLTSSVDYSFRAKPGTSISVRFKVGTLDNRSGAVVQGSSN